MCLVETPQQCFGAWRVEVRNNQCPHGVYMVVNCFLKDVMWYHGSQSQHCFICVPSYVSILFIFFCFVSLGVCWTLTLRNCVLSPSHTSMLMPVWCVASTFKVNKLLELTEICSKGTFFFFKESKLFSGIISNNFYLFPGNWNILRKPIRGSLTGQNLDISLREKELVIWKTVISKTLGSRISNICIFLIFTF